MLRPSRLEPPLEVKTQAVIAYARDGKDFDKSSARELRFSLRESPFAAPDDLRVRATQQWGRTTHNGVAGLFIQEEPWFLFQWARDGKEWSTTDHANTLERTEPGVWNLYQMPQTPALRETWSSKLDKVNFKLRISKSAMKDAISMIGDDFARLLLPKRRPAAVRVVDENWTQLWVRLVD